MSSRFWHHRHATRVKRRSQIASSLFGATVLYRVYSLSSHRKCFGFLVLPARCSEQQCCIDTAEFCRTAKGRPVCRTLKPDTPLEPLSDSFTAESCRTALGRAAYRTLKPETPLDPRMKFFTAEFVAQLGGFSLVAVTGSCTSSLFEAGNASGAFDELIHSRICRTVHRTLKPDTPTEPLLESFTREFVQQFIAP